MITLDFTEKNKFSLRRPEYIFLIAWAALNTNIFWKSPDFRYIRANLPFFNMFYYIVWKQHQFGFENKCLISLISCFFFDKSLTLNLKQKRGFGRLSWFFDIFISMLVLKSWLFSCTCFSNCLDISFICWDIEIVHIVSWNCSYETTSEVVVIL